MASHVEVERSDEDVQLKHLGFVRIVTIYVLVLVSNLYENAKQCSSSLRSTVDVVENAVTAVVGPVYDRFKGVPTDLLVFLDKKIDEGAKKFDEHAPPFAKTMAVKAQSFAHKASDVAEELVNEAKINGPLAAVSRGGEISKNLAVARLAVLCYKANHHPALHGLTEMAIPTAAYWSEKYNEVAKEMATKGYSVFNYVPLAPVEEMRKAYKQVEAGAGKKDGDDKSSSSGSDKEE